MACILDCRTFTVPPFAENEIEVNLTPKEVNDLILFGRVTECNTGTPVVGAIVKAFLCRNGNEIPITHNFSGCNGEYLINIPQIFFDPGGNAITINPGDTIIVKASCTTVPPTPCFDCATNPCTCPPPDLNG